MIDFGDRWRDLRERAFEAVDPASLNLFRIVFALSVGVRAALEIGRGKPETRWSYPVLFEYPGFGWVQPLEPEGMLWLYRILVAASIALVFGWRTRIAALVQATILTWIFLLDSSAYNNHDYLICQLSWLLVLAPTHCSGSLDARRRGVRPTPRWALWLLRFQIALPYFFGGVAKLNPDWLLRAEPIHTWMSQGRMEGTLDLPWFGELWFAFAICWAGLILDLLIVPALLWRRTRAGAFLVITAFHLTNSQLFGIGVFPWLMIGATTIFFEPDWPRRIGWRPRLPDRESVPRSSAVEAFLVTWILMQVVLPFRHLLYPGPVDWTEEGHRFAWRMKIRDKVGEVRFVVVDTAGRQTVFRDFTGVLTDLQRRLMIHDPEMIRQFANELADRLQAKTGDRPEVRALTRISFNGRPDQAMVDPTVDLASLGPSLGPKAWILPLETSGE